MKKISIYLILILLSGSQLFAQVDRSQRPEPGPAPIIQLGDFEAYTMDNGMRVILVENRQVPVVSFQLSLDIDPVLEGDAKGYVGMAGTLMREGTTSRSKREIDESIDFLGASISTSSTGIFASSLSRHRHQVLDLMSDILLNPSFPQSELERLITQSKSGLATTRNDAGSMAANVGRVAVYGPDHPYGEVTTEETLDNISLNLIKEYYESHFKPNVAYMVIVGDIDLSEAKELMDTYFGSWQPGNVPSRAFPTPTLPMGRRVAVADRTGAVQSVVMVTHPVQLTPGHEDAIKVSVMNSILGGGVFSGRLMQNLREDKGYTYGAGSSLASDRLVGRFTARTEVRNEVTGHTVEEILYEVGRMVDEPVEEESLQLTKNFMTGSFARSLESPRTIANFALNIERFELPEDYYANYLENLNAVTARDIQDMAARYLKPEQSIVVVAGNKDDVIDQLIPFSATGHVEFYDPFGRPIEAGEALDIPEGMTADDVMDRYFEALGGKEKLKGIQDITQEMVATTMGQQIQMTSYQKAPNYILVNTKMGGMVLAQQLFDGKKGVVAQMGNVNEFTEGPVYDQLKMQATLNFEMYYADFGVEKELVGIESAEGQMAYKIKMVMPTGEQSYEFYSVESGLKLKTISEETSAVYKDYQSTDGILFPMKITQEAGPQVIEITITQIQINTGLSGDIFTIE